ncbi:MAG: hypothetical protein ACRDNS_02140, partial [Trebonia sp.]
MGAPVRGGTANPAAAARCRVTGAGPWPAAADRNNTLPATSDTTTELTAGSLYTVATWDRAPRLNRCHRSRTPAHTRST